MDKVEPNGILIIMMFQFLPKISFLGPEPNLDPVEEPQISSSTSQEMNEILDRILQSQRLINSVPAYYRVHPPSYAMVQPITSKNDLDINNLLDMLE